MWAQSSSRHHYLETLVRNAHFGPHPRPTESEIVEWDRISPPSDSDA